MQKTMLFVFVTAFAMTLAACESSSTASGDAAVASASLVAAPAQALELVPRGDKTPQSPSGTRLRSIYFQGEDGSRLHLGFFDSQRKEKCSYRITHVGKDGILEHRCVPQASGGHACDEEARFYRDRDCTVPLHGIWMPDPHKERTPYYEVAKANSDFGCPKDTEQPGLYSIKSWIKPAVIYQKSGFDKSCSEFTVGFENYAFLELGEKVDPEAFVRAVMVTDMP